MKKKSPVGASRMSKKRMTRMLESSSESASSSESDVPTRTNAQRKKRYQSSESSSSESSEEIETSDEDVSLGQYARKRVQSAPIVKSPVRPPGIQSQMDRQMNRSGRRVQIQSPSKSHKKRYESSSDEEAILSREHLKNGSTNGLNTTRSNSSIRKQIPSSSSSDSESELARRVVHSKPRASRKERRPGKTQHSF